MFDELDKLNCKLDKLNCKLDESAKLNNEFVELDKFKMSSMIWVVISMSWPR